MTLNGVCVTLSLIWQQLWSTHLPVFWVSTSWYHKAKTLACSAGVFCVGESLLIGSLRWSRHLWFYDRGRLAPFPPLFGSFNMALSRLKPFARARWKRLHCRLQNTGSKTGLYHLDHKQMWEKAKLKFCTSHSFRKVIKWQRFGTSNWRVIRELKSRGRHFILNSLAYSLKIDTPESIMIVLFLTTKVSSLIWSAQGSPVPHINL